MLYTTANRPLQTIVFTPESTKDNNFTSKQNVFNYLPCEVDYPLSLQKKVPQEWNPFVNAHKNFYVPSIDQGKCGSCWAFSTVICLTDRLNILKKKKVLKTTLSPNLLLLCNIFSNFFVGEGEIITGNIDFEIKKEKSGCFGNNILSALFYLYFFGTSTTNCFPYDVNEIFEYKDLENNLSFYPYERQRRLNLPRYNAASSIFNLSSFESNTVPCAFYINQNRLPNFTCLNNVDENNGTFGSPLNSFFLSYMYKISTANAKYEIYKKGPIVTSFVVYRDFYEFDAKKKDAVYIHDPEIKDIVGGHAVEIVGWGETSTGIPFWWVRNMWGKSYGKQGFFRFFRGNNQCQFEANMIGFMPNLNLGKPFELSELLHTKIMKENYLKPLNPKNFLRIIKKVITTPFFLTDVNAIQNPLLSSAIESDYEKYGSLLMQLYRKIGIFSTRLTNNNFDFRALELMPFLDYYQDQSSSISVSDLQSKSDATSLPWYYILLFVYCVLFSGIFIFVTWQKRK